MRAATEPIRNPVTDKERVRAVLPEGWVFYEGEVGSGTVKGIGDTKFDFSKRHSSLAHFAFDNNGMAYSYEASKENLHQGIISGLGGMLVNVQRHLLVPGRYEPLWSSHS